MAKPIHYKGLMGAVCGATNGTVTLDAKSVNCEECRQRMPNLPPRKAKWADEDLKSYKGHDSEFLNTR